MNTRIKALRVFYENCDAKLYKGVVSVYNGDQWLYNIESPIDRPNETDALIDAQNELDYFKMQIA